MYDGQEMIAINLVARTSGRLTVTELPGEPHRGAGCAPGLASYLAALDTGRLAKWLPYRVS